MPAATRDYVVMARYFDDGKQWRREPTRLVDATFEQAGRTASRIARELDAKYGAQHFWTVNVHNADNLNSSYYELFHGRLR